MDRERPDKNSRCYFFMNFFLYKKKKKKTRPIYLNRQTVIIIFSITEKN